MNIFEIIGILVLIAFIVGVYLLLTGKWRAVKAWWRALVAKAAP